jgi:hypothetical protein
MDAAVFFFCTGGLLSLFCGLRIFVRIYRLMKRWGYGPRNDPIGDLVESIRLRDTFVLELIGWIAGTAMWIVATRYI